MKKKHLSYLLSCILAVTFMNSRVKAQEKLIHTIKVNTTKDLHEFFQYTGKEIPLISGHRGGREGNIPENSIAAFENTLQHTPAFFEIDPRLTKDSVIVLMHDLTLERTTNGKGKVSDFTWAELQQLRLKDANGNITDYRIPTLAETIEWARGKTILSLDWKGVPYQMTADLIRKHNAYSFVMVGIQNLKQAQFYLHENKNYMFAMFLDSEASVGKLESAGIPLRQVMAYVGSKNKPENKPFYEFLHKKGMMCMIAAAPVYDLLESVEERKVAYQTIIKDQVDIIESDLPIEVAGALKIVIPEKSSKKRFFGTLKLKAAQLPE